MKRNNSSPKAVCHHRFLLFCYELIAISSSSLNSMFNWEAKLQGGEIYRGEVSGYHLNIPTSDILYDMN